MPTDQTDPATPEAPLVEGVDYTVDRGRWVFTAAYLRRRGTCCDSGCRHCPYRSSDEPSPERPLSE